MINPVEDMATAICCSAKRTDGFPFQQSVFTGKCSGPNCNCWESKALPLAAAALTAFGEWLEDKNLLTIEIEQSIEVALKTALTR